MTAYGEDRTGSSPATRIKGWGADLRPEDRPSYPKETPSDVQTPRGRVGDRQIPDVKIHKSTEQPDLTPVFGTSCPPRGLSGKLRDIAYQYSEGRLAHWMTLMLADRVDMVEGVLEDLRHGKVPNTYKERGWTAKGSGRDRARRDLHIAIGLSVVGAVAFGVWAARRDRD
jgi:hypothetical protein